MPYLTQTQLETMMAVPRLADCCDDTVAGTADAGVVTDVIERACGVVDGYLQTAGYAIPMTGSGVTAALRHWTGMIAAHLAAQRRPAFRDAQGRAPYRVEYQDALEWLAKVAARKILLEAVEPTGGDTPDTPGGGMVLNAYRGGQRPPARPRAQRRW